MAEHIKDWTLRLEQSVIGLFRDALRTVTRHPALILPLARILYRQYRSSRLRLAWQRRGVHVPPFLIFSVTNTCNLMCSGCYKRALNRETGPELKTGRIRGILKEAQELGISIVLIAGGEPFTRQDVLNLLPEFRRMIFPVFTNGLMVDAAAVRVFRKNRNMIPVLSLEGPKTKTDKRRGAGVHEQILSVMEEFRKAGLFFGLSITVTSENFQDVTGDPFFETGIRSGCRLFFFVEYIPVEAGTEKMVLSAAQRENLGFLLARRRRDHAALLLAFPGDEKEFGGCLSSGRGFVHVSPSGWLEPCPFAPYSDTNLRALSLKTALGSRLLRQIRENPEKLSENGGCALWENREWVRSLVKGIGRHGRKKTKE